MRTHFCVLRRGLARPGPSTFEARDYAAYLCTTSALKGVADSARGRKAYPFLRTVAVAFGKACLG